MIRLGLLLAWGTVALSGRAAPVPEPAFPLLSPLPEVALPPGVELLFSPHDDLAARLRVLVGQARREIVLSQWAISDPGLVAALLAAERRGIFVVVVAERDTDPIAVAAPAYLAERGLPVFLARRARPDARHRQSLIIIDRETVALSTGGLTSAARADNATLLVWSDVAVAARAYNSVLDELERAEWIRPPRKP